jgi:hypothetical protein
MFDEQERQYILNEFPKFELSYETMIHNKVHDANVLLAIPDGTKFFAWFTIYKDENALFLLELDSNKNIKNIQTAMTSFNDKLVYRDGTIFYGTNFKHNSSNFFCIEDLYYYKGDNYTNQSYLTKLRCLKQILQTDILATSLFNKYVIFGLPLMNTNFNSLLREIELLPYKISQISFRYFDSKKSVFVKYYKPNNNNSKLHETNRGTIINNGYNNTSMANKIFKVKADIQNDIYNLYISKNGVDEHHDIAFIPDYTTSVMMNKLFRNIKENNNLDALEESDDEAEFENDREDKFVFLDRAFKMICQYNYKFKRWMPLSLANSK